MIRFCAICCAVFFGLFLIHQKVLPRYFLLNAEDTPVWNYEPSQEELEKVQSILKKPLKLFGYGSQCLAFTTEDDEYAVKLCRARRYRTLLPSRAKRRKENDFLSYSLAFHSIPEQSQVTFIHLNKTHNLNTTLEIVDPWGFSHFLKADDLAFYIQKKATPLPDYLAELPASQSKVLAKQLLDLFKSCCEEGLLVRDIYPKNIGVCKGIPFWIDPGRIDKKESLKEKEPQKKALLQFKNLLTPFLDADFSVLLDEEFEVSL